MKLLKIPLIAFALAFFATAFLPKPAKADEWNRRTVVKLSAPVEIPGVVLARGTYVFKLADSQSDRNIVQVFNKDESQIYATILAIPDYRVRATGKTVVTLEERPKGSPEAIRDWFYPGSRYGQEFVYSR